MSAPKQKTEPKTETTETPVETIEVTSMKDYNNGMLIDKPWKAGETRRIPRSLLVYLRNDLPGNWRVTGG